jgi:hypothetical protein
VPAADPPHGATPAAGPKYWARAAMSNYTTLKARQREERAHYPESLGLRIHRALSWLDKSEQSEDLDSQFIFLWIAFNAAYATELVESHRLSERSSFNHFIHKLVELDHAKHLHALVWQHFTGPIRVLLDNPYVSAAFWEMQAGQLPEAEFAERFEADKAQARQALANNNTAGVLAKVLESIYMLRNQIFHGGATWNGAVNREQLRDATKIMQVLVPQVITVMMDHPNALWGDAIFPVIGKSVGQTKGSETTPTPLSKTKR